MPLSLPERLAAAIDVSGAFDNCFFHSYAAYLLANGLPLPADLFTFASVLGPNSAASQIQTLFEHQPANLNLFVDYKEQQHAEGEVLLDPHCVVEKTLVLGFLLREWFSTTLATDEAHRDEMLEPRDDGQDILTRYTGYVENRAAGLTAADMCSESPMYEANEAFLEYLFIRSSVGPDASNPFENYFAGDVSITNAIKEYWRREGYDAYCKHLANPRTKLTPNDMLPVLITLQQPIRIYGTSGNLQVDLPIDVPRPILELKLHASEGHYHLLKRPGIEEANPDDDLLQHYADSFTQYKADRAAVLEAETHNKQAIADAKPSLLVGAICPAGNVPWDPFAELLRKIQQIKDHMATMSAALNVTTAASNSDADEREAMSASPPISDSEHEVDTHSPAPDDESNTTPLLRQPLRATEDRARRAKLKFEKGFEEPLRKMAEKRDFLAIEGGEYDQAYRAACRLIESIVEAKAMYLSKPTKRTYLAFKSLCNEVINAEKDELIKKDSTWGQLFAEIALAILGGIVLYVIAAGIHKAVTGHFRFFQPEAVLRVDELKRGLDYLEPESPSPKDPGPAATA
jgi:hypothetical protein